jgi:hypothetical protein
VGRVHHPCIWGRGIAPLRNPSYQRPRWSLSLILDVSSCRGNGSQLPPVRGFSTLSVLWPRGLHPRTSEDFAAVSSPRLPLALACLEWSPMFPLTDSTSALRWRLADHLSRVLRLLGGAEGTSGRSMPSTDSQRYLGVSDDRCQPQKPAHCPLGHGLEAGGSCPAGRHPLRVHSPWALSAKPDVLTACLASQRYLAGACDSPCRASGRASPQRLIHLLIRRMGISSHSANEPHGAPRS